jgi:putative transposase
MARFARLVVPGYLHHITQRGVRSLNIFADDDDRCAYLVFRAGDGDVVNLFTLAL